MEKYSTQALLVAALLAAVAGLATAFLAYVVGWWRWRAASLLLILGVTAAVYVWMLQVVPR